MSGNIAEKLGLGNEVREFKLGKSFTDRTGNAFHSVRYDFKPASVDTTKMATVDMGESNQVTVTVPHVEGTAQTVFRGSRRPYQKECVLIIDHNTGEITLEKLSTNIQLKKTRAEGSSRALQARPITPIENPPPANSNFKKTSPNNGHSQPLRYSPKNNSHSPGNGNQRSWNSPHTSPLLDSNVSPSMPNILALSTTQSSSSRSGHKDSRNNGNISQALPPSMPQLLGKDNTLIVEPQDEVGVLSDSSGSDSSSSSGEEEEEEEEEDHDEGKIREPRDELEAMLLSGEQEPMDTNGPRQDSHSSSGSSSGSSSDSDDSQDSPTKSSSNTNVNELKPSAISPPKAPKGVGSALSMPKFSQLSEDLQLSESGSDSDD